MSPPRRDPASPGQRLESFAWVGDPAARVLLLGSMPGVASLAAQRYYAHPRNAFWPIMGALFAAGPELAYAERLERLRRAGVALWDVVHRCRRSGSLDAAIASESVEPNDFAALFAACPRIHSVFFNGGTARLLYRRHVLPSATGRVRALALVTLPSTSPAHAALGFADKLARWRQVAQAAARG
ncbi:MAG TPA: DNA-deoxyinosine glycosylase [Gammaproteobacteria bacterium]